MTKNIKSTIDQKEVTKFAKIADDWWNENGKFKPLHKLNPTRITYIREKLIEYLKLDKNSPTPLSKLKEGIRE